MYELLQGSNAFNKKNTSNPNDTLVRSKHHFVEEMRRFILFGTLITEQSWAKWKTRISFFFICFRNSLLHLSGLRARDVEDFNMTLLRRCVSLSWRSEAWLSSSIRSVYSSFEDSLSRPVFWLNISLNILEKPYWCSAYLFLIFLRQHPRFAAKH